MAFSKIIFNGTTQMDLTQDTVVADKLYQNYTAHGADGLPIVGTATGGGGATLQSKTRSYTPTTSAQSETVSADSGYDGLSSVAVTVAAMPTGTAGTPSASKGTVSNHAVSVTPSVTNTTGYITGGTKTGTAVSVSASELVSGTKTISANGTGIDVTNYASVDVAVPGSSPNLQSKTGIVPATSSQTITADSGYDGLSSVQIDAMPTGSYGTPTWTKVISQGSRLLVAPSFPNFDDGYIASAPSISTTLTLEQKSVTPSETAQTVNPTSTDYYMSAVNVGAIPSDYVGSGVTQRDSTDLTASGATVTAPAGYYESAATKAVASGTATPAASISATGATVSTGTNTLTLSKSVSNTPQVSAGYVSAGTAGNSSVSLTATVTTQAAQTIYPSASDQTIASGRYLTGTQTIKAVTTTNLTAANIKKGVTVQIGDSADADRVTSVTGTYEGGSSMNTQIWLGRAQRTANSYGATDATLTVAKAGTYTVSWTAWRSSSSGTMGTNLHVNSTTGTNQQTFTGTYGQNIQLTNQQYSAGDVLTIYATSGSNSRSIYVANLIIEQTA